MYEPNKYLIAVNQRDWCGKTFPPYKTLLLYNAETIPGEINEPTGRKVIDNNSDDRFITQVIYQADKEATGGRHPGLWELAVGICHFFFDT